MADEKLAVRSETARNPAQKQIVAAPAVDKELPTPQPEPVQENYAQRMLHTTQPVLTPAMSLQPGVNARNSKGLPLDSKGQRAWSHGLMDCCKDPGTCCEAWCLPCTLYSEIKTRLDSLNSTGAVHPQGGDGWGPLCWAWCCSGGFSCFLDMALRGEIRQRYNISDEAGNDCMAAWCCEPCSLAQVHRELRLEEEQHGQPIAASNAQETEKSDHKAAV